MLTLTPVLPVKALAGLGQQGLREQRQAGDGQPALLEIANGLGKAVNPLQPDIGALHLLDQQQCLGCRHQPPTFALEQVQPGDLLQPGQLAADGGLRSEQQASCGGDAARRHDGAEHFDMANGQFHGNALRNDSSHIRYEWPTEK